MKTKEIEKNKLCFSTGSHPNLIFFLIPLSFFPSISPQPSILILRIKFESQIFKAYLCKVFRRSLLALAPISARAHTHHQPFACPEKNTESGIRLSSGRRPGTNTGGGERAEERRKEERKKGLIILSSKECCLDKCVSSRPGMCMKSIGSNLTGPGLCSSAYDVT